MSEKQTRRQYSDEYKSEESGKPSRIVEILKEGEAGVPVADLVRKHGISTATCYGWKSKYAGMAVNLDFCSAPVKTCSGVNLSGETLEYLDGRRDQMLESAP